MKILIIIFSVILFSGCFKKTDPSILYPFESFQKFTLDHLIYSTEIGEIYSAGEKISRPAGLNQLVTSFLVGKEDSILSRRICLYYKIPFKEVTGVLAFTEVKNAEACEEIGDQDNILVKLDQVLDFRSEVKNFKYHMSFTYKGESQKISFPIPNIEMGKTHEKYRAKKINALYPGLKVLKLNDNHFSTKNSPFLGRFSDRFEDGSAIRCMQVQEGCKIVGENLCDLCKYGSYEVVDFSCPQGGSRFCGQNRCGQKNAPACPIGAESKTEDQPGICQEDLTPVLNSDKIWVCQ